MFCIESNIREQAARHRKLESSQSKKHGGFRLLLVLKKRDKKSVDSTDAAGVMDACPVGQGLLKQVSMRTIKQFHQRSIPQTDGKTKTRAWAMLSVRGNRRRIKIISVR